MKHRSADPAVGVSALGSMRLPTACRLIFYWPKCSAVRASPKVTRFIPITV